MRPSIPAPARAPVGWWRAAALAFAACGGATPPPAANVAVTADPWRVPSGTGVTQGEPDARFVPPSETRPPREREPGDDVARGSLQDGPSGSPPADRRPFSQLEARMPAIRAGMRRCYEKALAKDPTLRRPGPAKVDFSSDGKTARVLFDGKPPQPGSLEACLADVIVRGTQPVVEGGTTIVIPAMHDDT